VSLFDGVCDGRIVHVALRKEKSFAGGSRDLYGPDVGQLNIADINPQEISSRKSA
jgi:hypothetical protein